MGDPCSLDQRLARAATEVEPGDRTAGGESFPQVVERVEAKVPGVTVRAGEIPLPVHPTVGHDCRPLQLKPSDIVQTTPLASLLTEQVKKINITGIRK